MTTTLDSNRQQMESLSELRGRMDRADLQLDHSLAALGTVYSQLLLIGTNEVDSDRADQFRDDIGGEVLALKDIVDSLNEVYSSTSEPLPEPVESAAARAADGSREQVKAKQHRATKTRREASSRCCALV